MKMELANQIRIGTNLRTLEEDIHEIVLRLNQMSRRLFPSARDCRDRLIHWEVELHNEVNGMMPEIEQ